MPVRSIFQRAFAIILSGSGYLDGAEIQESVLTMLAVRRVGGTYQCFAPNVNQHHVTNHLTQETTEESRNVLVEAARIARSDVLPLNEYKPDKFDALLMPGGYGAAQTLCDFAYKGAECFVNGDVELAIKGTHAAGKPIGALCIAPVILGKLIEGVTLTVGQDEGVNEGLQALGAKTQNTTHGQIVVDEEKKVVSTPCYMLDASVDQIADGAQKLVEAVILLT